MVVREPERAGASHIERGSTLDAIGGPPAARVAPPAVADKYRTDIVHLYRAHVGRATSWRRRLDTTTNWAVVTTAAAISFALGGVEPQRHVVLLLMSILVTFFLLLEARRYRHYDIWRTRAYILERYYFAPLLDGESTEPDTGWQHWLADDLRNFHYRISFAQAFGRRLRRNYVWIYLTLLLTWFVKVAIHPTPIDSLEQFFARTALGPLSGTIMVLVGLLFNGALIAAAVTTWYFDPTARSRQGITIREISAGSPVHPSEPDDE
ncbi:MAG: DUF2270 domain-containing protein [Chloroflexota bacterium]|nr:DUF2270 domain-containing protein [Chloroflexota bacterium]